MMKFLRVYFLERVQPFMRIFDKCQGAQKCFGVVSCLTESWGQRCDLLGSLTRG